MRIAAVDRGKPHSELLSGIQRMPDRSPTIRPLRLSVKFILMLLGQDKKRNLQLEVFFGILFPIAEPERTESVNMEPSSVVRWSNTTRPASIGSASGVPNPRSPSGGGSSCWGDVESANQAPLARLESSEEIVFPSVV